MTNKESLSACWFSSIRSPKGQGVIQAFNASEPLLCFLVDAFLPLTLGPLNSWSQGRKDEKQTLFGEIVMGPLSPSSYWLLDMNSASSGYGSVSTSVGCQSKAFTTPYKTESL